MTGARPTDDLAELRLDGRSALITGGARGLGKAIAELIGRRGAAVLLVDLDATTLERTVNELVASGVDALGIQGDVSKAETAHRSVAACVERWGHIDILVNNAGIGGRQVPIWEIEDQDWKRVLEVNLDSAFYFCKAAVPRMIERGYGRIVSMASMAGKEGNASNGQYSVSKAGIIGLTKSLGKELALKGVLVNAVAPAVIETDILKGEGIDPKVRDLLISKIPMGRMGQPVELARLVGFLVSDQLTFSTGFVYDLSGGRATY